MFTIDEITASAYATLLWSTGDGSDGYLDGIDADPSPALMPRLREFVQGFLNAAILDLDGLEPAQIGHDLILTANGHGAGFWDRGLGERGERLSDAARELGPVDAYIGDDGLIYVMGWERA